MDVTTWMLLAYIAAVAGTWMVVVVVGCWLLWLLVVGCWLLWLLVVI